MSAKVRRVCDIRMRLAPRPVVPSGKRLAPELDAGLSTFSIGGVVQATYQYDFEGRQAIRQLPQAGSTIHSVFASSGNRIAEYDEATGALIREYVWNGLEPVAVIEGGVIYSIRTRCGSVGRWPLRASLSNRFRISRKPQ